MENMDLWQQVEAIRDDFRDPLSEFRKAPAGDKPTT